MAPGMKDRLDSRNDIGGGGPDGSAAAPVTARLGSAGRGPEILVGLIAVFVALALIKPWGLAGGGPRPTPRATPAAVAAASTDPLAALRHHCQEPSGWRIYAV